MYGVIICMCGKYNGTPLFLTPWDQKERPDFEDVFIVGVLKMSSL